MSQENPELSGIIMEINDLRGFDRLVTYKRRSSGGTARRAGRSGVVLYRPPLLFGNGGRGVPPLASKAESKRSPRFVSPEGTAQYPLSVFDFSLSTNCQRSIGAPGAAHIPYYHA
jgi:hypothetical protein